MHIAKTPRTSNKSSTGKLSEKLQLLNFHIFRDQFCPSEAQYLKLANVLDPYVKQDPQAPIKGKAIDVAWNRDWDYKRLGFLGGLGLG